MNVYPPDLNLDIAGAIEGTDKSSSHSYAWGYLRSYARVLSHLRNSEFNFLEIGVLGGSSLRLWKNFFPKAIIIGLDINERCRSLAEDRVIIEIGSQTDSAFIGRIGSTYRPTVVIDDGSHQAGDIVYTFEHMFGFLAEGGVYIVEDTSFHLGPKAQTWNKARSIPIDYYFWKISESLMARRSNVVGASPGLMKLLSEIESIAFIPGAILIHKRIRDFELTDAINTADCYLTSINNNDPEKHVRLAEYMLKHMKGTDLPMRQINKALELDSSFWRAYFVQALLLERAGKLDEAVTAARRAGQLQQANAACLAQLGRLLVKTKDVAGALAALERAHSLKPADSWISELLQNARNQSK